VRKVLTGVVIGAVALVCAAVALAQTGTKQKYKETLTTKKTGKPTGTTITLSTSDPTNTSKQNQPDPARRLVFTFPKGFVIDQTTVSRCSATDTDFSQKGDAACPASSRVVTGSGTVNTGFPPPSTHIPITVHGYNGNGELLLYVISKTSFVIHAKVKSPKTRPVLDATVPPTCLPPGSPATNPPCQFGEAPIDSIVLTLSRKTNGKKAFLRTAKACPKSHKWAFALNVTFKTIPAQKVTSKASCTA
jgi:hypothetical protein